MGSIDKRLSALEAVGSNRVPVQIELIAGPTIGRIEADVQTSEVPDGATVTRIELVGVVPEAQILKFSVAGG